MFGRGQGISYGGIPKLIAPEISLGGNFSYDVNGQYYGTTKIYGYIKKETCKYSYQFLLGLLNSKIFWFFIKNTGYVLRGGYYTFKTNYIYPFPIPNYDTVEQNLIKEVEEEVYKILTDRYKSSNENLSISMMKIDYLLYRIYDFDKEDIFTIEQ